MNDKFSIQINKKIIQKKFEPVRITRSCWIVCNHPPCHLTCEHIFSLQQKNCCLLTTLFCRQMEPHPVNHLNKIDRMKKVNNMVTFLLGSEIQVLGIHDTAPDDVLLNSKYLTFITKKQNTISYLQEHSHTVTYSCYLKTSSPLQYNFPGWVGGILGQASVAKQKTGLPPPGYSVQSPWQRV